MTLQLDAENLKSNLIKILSICQESLREIDNSNNSEILKFLEVKNNEIKSIVQENESIISAHRVEYMTPLRELKKITEPISDNKNA